MQKCQTVAGEPKCLLEGVGEEAGTEFCSLQA